MTEAAHIWLMNVGLLWMALGALLTAVKFAQAQAMVPSFWLWVGLGCACSAWLRAVRYLKIPAANGTLLIIEDEQKAVLLAELAGRRMNQLRRWHDFIDANDELLRGGGQGAFAGQQRRHTGLAGWRAIRSCRPITIPNGAFQSGTRDSCGRP